MHLILIMSFPSQPISKRIIICCDGIWQSAVSGVKSSPSNIARLAQSLEQVAVDNEGNVWQQIVWYDSGVGTTSSARGRVVEGVVGDGLEGNVIEAYNFIVLNWSPGDKIFCFGFSRGAYTARTIAGLVSDIGICQPSDMNNFSETWEFYKKAKGGKFCGSDEYFEWIDGKLAEKQDGPLYSELPKEQIGLPSFEDRSLTAEFDNPDVPWGGRLPVWERRGYSDWDCDRPESHEVEVVGVFDTVGSLGVPTVLGFEAKLPWSADELQFHNVSLNRSKSHQAKAELVQV